MYSSRKTWDLGTTPCLQDLWKIEPSLDNSCQDILISDSEDEVSMKSALIQCRGVSEEWTDPSSLKDLYLTIKSLREKVSQYKSRLRNEEARRKLQLQVLHKAHDQSIHEKLVLVQNLEDVVREQEAQIMNLENGGVQQKFREVNTTFPPLGPSLLQEGKDGKHIRGLNRANNENQGTRRHSFSGRPLPSVQKLIDSVNALQEEKLRLQEEKLILTEKATSKEAENQIVVKHLRDQVDDLTQKLQYQTQEVNRLLSELDTTDLKRQLEFLSLENESLKQELSTCHREVEGLKLASVSCSDFEQNKETRDLQERLTALDHEVEEKSGQLSEVKLELQQKTDRLAELELRLKDCLREKAEEEERLQRELRVCEQEKTRLSFQPPQVKYITKTVEVDSPRLKQALCDAQSRNEHFQEQIAMQKQLIRDLEQQLQESQQQNVQLHAETMMYQAELDKTRGQMVEEIQTMEDEKNRVIEEAFSRAQTEMKAVHENLAGVRLNLRTLQPALRTLTSDYNCLKRQVRQFPFLLQNGIRQAKEEISSIVQEVNVANQELLKKYRRELQLRKKCHNELVRLKGNIRVFCRVRPKTKEDGEGEDAMNVVNFDQDDDAILYVLHKGKPIPFEMDKVFPPETSQEDIFKEVEDLITSSIDGYNVCIFAYGQTGSGKTYTMEGTAEHPGINQRALRLLFSEVEKKVSDWKYTITVSMAEIYNETLRDLLGKDPQEKLDIRLSPDGSGQLYVPGLTEFTVRSVADVNRVFELGHMNRATECTNLNEHSSRSHALLIITVHGVNYGTGIRTSGKLNLVDLAGSERVGKSGAEGNRLREAQCINKSLSALGDVIYALRSRHAHVPFRNSKLTYLLQDSLNGDSKTLMMVQVSPVESSSSETICSLKFAQRVRSVELGPGTRKLEPLSSPSQEQTEADSPPLVSSPVVRCNSIAVVNTVKTGGLNRRKLPGSGKR
ncbi:kinesin-like protein KIFC3 isoform X2 [Protopterus annectens]|uniref:kinesin-like protein KIFC3 isoform X2 n=1 Tax=Protopterus annectens TaxID=7888 RepID=UPI001CF9B199|nr:kinesin-like protein KIFC3 isoform X2 [Protopterus annectens]